MKNLLLTGGTGFIGRNLIRELMKIPMDISLIKRKSSNLNEFEDIDQIYTELQINTKLTKAEQDIVEEGISKTSGRIKPTLH